MSSRRHWTPCRVCGGIHSNPVSSSICPTCGQAERAASEAAAEQEDRERYRYLPASWRARDKLAEALGEDTAQLIEDYVKAMIAERHG